MMTFLCIYFDINSIRAEGRLDKLTQICNTLKCDCLLLTETKTDETIPSNMLAIDGYHLPLRHDRNIHGGETIIYVADHLTYKHQGSLQINEFEHLWVDIKVKDRIYAVNALYRPSTQTSSQEYETFLAAADNVLTRLSNHSADTSLFLSAMNFGNCYSKSPILSPKPLDSSAPELFQSLFFFS